MPKQPNIQSRRSFFLHWITFDPASASASALVLVLLLVLLLVLVLVVVVVVVVAAAGAAGGKTDGANGRENGRSADPDSINFLLALSNLSFEVCESVNTTYTTDRGDDQFIRNGVVGW